MKHIPFGSSGQNVPAVALGCMRIRELSIKKIPAYLGKALDLGVNYFDHADIYGDGECEALFGEGIRALGVPRDRLIIQSKCGIIPHKMYDFSYEHIMEAVEGSLRRLGTDHLDALLLHRPDALMEPEEVARAFDRLEQDGKVRYFGVSNFKPSQIALLQTAVKQPLQANQLQFSLPFAGMIASGIEVNRVSDGAPDRDGDVLNFSRLNKMTIQAWSPFRGKDGAFLGDRKNHKALNDALRQLSGKYGVSETTLAAAWILRHPAKIQLIAGTMNATRLSDIVKATEVDLSREDWYALYNAAGYAIP